MRAQTWRAAHTAPPEDTPTSTPCSRASRRASFSASALRDVEDLVDALGS